MGSAKTKDHISSFKRAFFITVILLIKVSFLCCHCFKHFSKSTIMGSKFAWNIRVLSLKKVNLSELALLVLHLNFLFKYASSLLIMLPIRKTWHFLYLIPELLL